MTSAALAIVLGLTRSVLLCKVFVADQSCMVVFNIANYLDVVVFVSRHGFGTILLHLLHLYSV